MLLDRVLALLLPALTRPGAVAVDATLGLGGHAAGLLAAAPGVRLIGIDRDPQALELAGQRLTAYADRIDLVHAVYDELPSVLAERGLERVSGVLFDLGVSSLQIDEAERGFSYARDAPLDMRMDAERGPTAADVLNGYDAGALTRVFRTYGEERFAARIARAVVREREQSPFTTSERFVELVRDAVPAPARRTGGHPAKRVFQALRIEVNGELGALERAVPAALTALEVGGRVAVLSYHSLEDRIVKRALTSAAVDRTPLGLPVPLAGQEPELRLLTRGSEPASEAELAANPRAASARLRAAERVRVAP